MSGNGNIFAFLVFFLACLHFCTAMLIDISLMSYRSQTERYAPFGKAFAQGTFLSDGMFLKETLPIGILSSTS